MRSMKKKGKRLKDDENHGKRAKKSNHKKTIIQIIFILITIILIMFATQYVFKEIERKENIEKQQAEIKEKEENIKKLSENRDYEKMSIENIEIYEKYGNTYFTAEIKNKTENKFEEKEIVIDFLDRENKSIIKFGYHLKEIEPGEKQEIKIITKEDLSEAYDFKIEN